MAVLAQSCAAANSALVIVLMPQKKGGCNKKAYGGLPKRAKTDGLMPLSGAPRQGRARQDEIKWTEEEEKKAQELYAEGTPDAKTFGKDLSNLARSKERGRGKIQAS